MCSDFVFFVCVCVYVIFMEIAKRFCLLLTFTFAFAGLLSWNMSECHVNLEEELNNLTNHGLEGEAARHGN